MNLRTLSSALVPTALVSLSLAVAACGGDKKDAAAPTQPQPAPTNYNGYPGQPGQPGAYPAQPGAYPAQPGQPGAQPGAYPAQPGAQPGYPAQPGAQPGYPQPGQPGQPAPQPGASAQPAGIPGMPPGFQIPGMPGAQPQPGGQPAAAGGGAQPLDPNLAAPAAMAIQTIANTEAPGMVKEGGLVAGSFQQGQTLEGTFSMAPGKCYTIVASGLGVQQVDVAAFAVPPAPLPPTQFGTAKGTTTPTGSQAILGGKANCLKLAFVPMAVPAKFVITAVRGAGMAAVQVYSK